MKSSFSINWFPSWSQAECPKGGQVDVVAEVTAKQQAGAQVGSLPLRE